MDFLPAGVAGVQPKPRGAGSRSQHPRPCAAGDALASPATPPGWFFTSLCPRGRSPGAPRLLLVPHGSQTPSSAIAPLRALNTGFHARSVYLLPRPEPRGFPLLFGMATPLGRREKSSPEFVPLSPLFSGGSSYF